MTLVLKLKNLQIRFFALEKKKSIFKKFEKHFFLSLKKLVLSKHLVSSFLCLQYFNFHHVSVGSNALTIQTQVCGQFVRLPALGATIYARVEAFMAFGSSCCLFFLKVLR